MKEFLKQQKRLSSFFDWITIIGFVIGILTFILKLILVFI